MKDLLVYAADADAQAFMRSILNRPQAVGIREISFDIERHPQRDPGIIQSGAELVRLKKGMYRKALLMCDYHGSGRDHQWSPTEVEDNMKDKLNKFSWTDNSDAIVLVPELEQWIWYCDIALAAHYGIPMEQIIQWIDDRANKLGKELYEIKKNNPKELFEYIIRERLQRTISPRDFEQIGKRCSVSTLKNCPSFKAMSQTLITWFPRVNES